MPYDTRTVAILIFDQVELLDFAGPYQVFSSVKHPDTNERLMNVFTVAESADPLECSKGLRVIPDYALESCPPFDMILVPGGMGTRTAVHRQPLIDWIAERSRDIELTTSVCTGSFLLAQAGLLDGKPATTHYASIERMRETYSTIDVREQTRWTEDGNILTSAGVSAGIDMALYVLQRLYGKPVADATATSIEYEHWQVD